jgi:prophage maintenance system killer protein
MITLEVADLVIVASRTLGLDTGQVLDLLDADAAEIALTRARPGADHPDPASQAAALLCALVQGQPLRHGNERVALAATLQFLALNGWDVDTDPPDAAAALVTGAATGARGAADVADWLEPRLRPATNVREEPMRARPALPLAERIMKATRQRRRPTGVRRFTDRTRRVIVQAQDDARLLKHNYIGTEHLLLGLVGEGEGVGAKALESMGLSLLEIRRQVIEITGHGRETPVGHIPFTPRAKKVLELSLREAIALGHNYIGTEHLLLGMLKEEHGVAGRLLITLGADHDRVRDQVTALLNQRAQANQAIIAENQRLHRELDRLRGILRAHGIEPDGGTSPA